MGLPACTSAPLALVGTPAEGLCSPEAGREIQQGCGSRCWQVRNKESEPPRAVVREPEDLSWCQPRQGRVGMASSIAGFEAWQQE